MAERGPYTKLTFAGESSVETSPEASQTQPLTDGKQSIRSSFHLSFAKHRQTQNRATNKIDEMKGSALLDILTAAPSAGFKGGSSSHMLSFSRTDSQEAMSMLVQHVKLDPDGGLANISLDGDANLEASLVAGKTPVAPQISKIEHLRKNSTEKFAALTSLLRVGLNTSFVLYRAHVAFKAIAGHSDEHSIALRKHHSAVRLPYILEIQAGISAIELLVCSYMFMIAFYTMSYALWATNSEQRYFSLAQLFWRHMPEITNLSALKALSYVHPVMVTKRLNQLGMKDLSAIYVLLNFFKKREHGLFPDQMAVDVAKIYVKHRFPTEEDRCTQACLQYAAGAVDNSPSDALNELLEVMADVPTEEAQKKLLNEFDVNPKALNVMCRVWLLIQLELLCFQLTNALLFLIGFLAVVSKVSASTVVLVDTSLPIWMAYLHILAFMNQIVGIFSIDELLINRIFMFVFGGTDAKLQVEERYLIDVYMGHLMRHIWSSTLPLGNKLALLFKLDDDDIQQLVVEEDYGHKAQITACVGEFLKRERLLGNFDRFREAMCRRAASKYD